jgi:hypothetical protein
MLDVRSPLGRSRPGPALLKLSGIMDQTGDGRTTSGAAGHPAEYLPHLALGNLPRARAEAVRAHVQACETCRAELDRLVRAARHLPLAARAPARMPPRWIMACAAAATAIAMVVGAFLAGRAMSDGASGDAALDRQLARAAALGRLEVSTATNDGARISVVRDRESSDAFAWVEQLPVLETGRAYQAWLSPDGMSFEPSGVFTEDEGGVWLSAEKPLDNYSLLALTIEDRDGADVPSGAPFLVVRLQP